MEIFHETLGNAEKLALIGDLDSFSVSILRERLNRLFEQKRYNIVIDLGEVPFVDSAGLGQLVNALKTAVNQRGDLILVKPNEAVQELLRITRLDTIFRIFDNIEDAVNVFPSNPAPDI